MLTYVYETGLGSHTDLKRMKDGQLGGQFWSVYIEVCILFILTQLRPLG